MHKTHPLSRLTAEEHGEAQPVLGRGVQGFGFCTSGPSSCITGSRPPFRSRAPARCRSMGTSQKARPNWAAALLSSREIKERKGNGSIAWLVAKPCNRTCVREKEGWQKAQDGACSHTRGQDTASALGGWGGPPFAKKTGTPLKIPHQQLQNCNTHPASGAAQTAKITVTTEHSTACHQRYMQPWHTQALDRIPRKEPAQGHSPPRCLDASQNRGPKSQHRVQHP